MRLKNYEGGLKAFQIAETYVTPSSLQHLLVLTPVFYGLVVTGRLDEAEATCKRIEEIFPQIKVMYSIAISNEIAYLKSALAYARGNLQEAWMILQGEHDFSSDRNGLAAVVRIFEIMLLIDRNLTDIASQKLENLRKHLARYPPDPRIQAIYKLLAAQEKYDFQFQHFKNEESLLKAVAGNFMNSQSGIEAVHFERWYAQRFAHNT